MFKLESVRQLLKRKETNPCDGQGHLSSKNRDLQDGEESNVMESRKKIVASFGEQDETRRLQKLQEIFSPEFYLATNTDIEDDPWAHFINHGRFEGRCPGLLFDASYVTEKKRDLGQNADVFMAWLADLDSDGVQNSCGELWDLYLNSLVSSSRKKSQCLRDEFIRFSQILSKLGFVDRREALIFCRLFDPRLAVPEEAAWLEALEIWVEGGAQEEFSPFFIGSYYGKKIGLSFPSEIEAFKHWFNEGYSKVAPTPVFNLEFYLETYPDLQAHPDPFGHFLIHGRFEGRSPNPLLNQHALYNKAVDESSCPFSDWLLDGCVEEGIFPGWDVLVTKKLPSGEIGSEKKASLMISLFDSFSERFSTCGEFSAFCHCVSSSQFNSNNLPESLSDRISAWCSAKDPLIGSFMFDPEFISDLEDDKAGCPEYFSFWLREFSLEDSSPTPIFDPEFYRSRYLDLQGYSGNVFMHYLHHGQYENRAPCALVDPEWISNSYELGGKTGIEFYFAAEKDGRNVKPAPGFCALNFSGLEAQPSFGLYELAKFCSGEGVFDLSKGSELYSQIKKAAAIEPLIKVVDPSRAVGLMPFNSDPYPVIKGLPEIIGRADILIFRDSINFGGADVILGLVYRAFSERSPGKRVKIISMGPVDAEVVKSRGLDSDDVVCLNERVEGLHQDVISHLVFDIVIGSRAERVVNLNCGPLWRSTLDYGKIFINHTALDAYLFCDDRDEFGNVDGYPARYLAAALPYLNKIYLDSDQLKLELGKRGINGPLAVSKIRVLKTPYEGIAHLPEKKFGYWRPRVAWAGRFDAQKRPDLLYRIAQELPEVDFLVWGKAMLGRKDYGLDRLPNIQLMGLYQSEVDIIDQGCGVFLYTSEWDGVPTILLRMMELNLPVVASAVGGVGELIPEAYLVKEIEDVSDYVSKLKEVLSDQAACEEEFKRCFEVDRKARNFTVYSAALEV